MPIAEDSAGGSPVPIPTNLTTNLTGEATGSGTLDYTTGDIDIAVTVVDNGHNHILENITDVQVNNAISGQILVYNGTVWANATNTAGITALVQDTSPALGGNLNLNNRNITGTGNIAITGTIDGRDVSADGTKLDGIESGATADQTAAQIKTAYESNANTNNFANADVSKLSGIEPGATADQTAAQIKTAYESNSNTNAFTDADHTKLDGIETAADVTDTANVVASLTAGTNVTIAADGTISATGGTSGIAHVVDDTSPELGGNLSLNSHDITGTGNLNFTGNLTLSGTVDGRDVAADGTKLDGIEASADVTDTANVTAAGALMDSEVTNLAQVKAFDSSDYATSAQGTTANAALPKAGGTMTGDILFNDGVKAKFGTSSDLQIWHNGTDSYVYDTGEGDLILRGSSNIKLQSAGGTALSTFTAAGASTLYYSAAEKLATTSTGINVTGKAGINVSSPSAYLHIKDDTAANDDYDVQIESFRPNLVFEDISGSATDYQIFVDSNAMKFLYGDASTNTKLANEVLEINTSGIDVTGNVDATGTISSGAMVVENSGGYGNIEIGGGSGAYIDLKAPFSDDYDFRIITVGTSTTMNGQSGNLILQREGNSKLTVTTSGVDVTGRTITTGTSGTTQWQAGSGANKLTIASYDNNIFYHKLSSGNSTQYQIGVEDNIPIHTITNNLVRTALLGNGNFGVGHTSPVAKMAILGSSNSTITEANSNLCVEGSGGNGMLFGTLSTTGFKSYIQSGFVANLGLATYDLLLNPEGGNVGIGDISPEAPLTVTGTIKSNGSGYNPANTGWATNASLITSGSYGGGLTMIDGSNAFSVRVDTGGLAMRIAQGATSGALGSDIAVFTNSGLDVTGDVNSTGTFKTTKSGTGQQLFNATVNLGTLTRGFSLVSPAGDNGSDPFKWETGNSIKWELDGAEAKSMFLNSAGNLGVGTYSPSYKIDARGAANADVAIQVKASGTGDVDAELRLDAADTGEALVRFARDGTTRAISEYTNSNEWNFTTYNDDKIDFQPNSTNVLRLTDDNIYAYKTVNVTGGVTVSTNLNVGNATPAGGGTIESHVQSSSTPALITYSGSSSLRTHISFENFNGQVGKINTAGTQTFYVTSSDYRLKTDIQPMQGSIDRVKALNPCNFEWVNDGGRVDGFIAHEVQDVVPEAIVGEKDAMQDQKYVQSEATGDIYTPAVKATYITIQVELTPAVEATYDDEGNELTPAVDATYEEQQQELTPAIDEVIHSTDVVEPDELEQGQLWRETTEKVMATRQVPDYQGIDQSKIVPLLTAALQDAIAKIEALETRLTALES